MLDAYSGAHVGNTALLDSSLDNLGRAFPEAAFVALAKDPSSLEDFCGCPCRGLLFPDLLTPERRAGWRALLWLVRNGTWAAVNTVNLGILRRLGVNISPLAYSYDPERRRAVEAVMDADIVVSISGEMLHDQFRRVTLFLLHGYWMAQRLGKPAVIFPQSIGPLRRSWLRLLARRVLNGCGLVMPRDRVSEEELKRIGVRPEIVEPAPDVAILQPQVSRDEALALLAAEGFNPAVHPVLGVTVSDYRADEGADGQDYLNAVRRLCEYVALEREGQVVFLSANVAAFGPEHEDLPVARRLYDALPEKARARAVLFSRILGARQFKGVANLADVFVTTRMHASILASMSPVPTITINTQRKLRGYMEVIGQEKYSVDVADATFNRLQTLFEECLANGDAIRRRLLVVQDELTPKVLSSGKAVRRLWDRRRHTGCVS